MLKLQQECFENIKTLCANYKKDGAQRKTEDYLCQRLEALEKLWQDFQERHLLLLGETEAQTTQYFTENIYDNVELLYKNTKLHMEGLLQQLRDRKHVSFDTTGIRDDFTDNNIQRMLCKQECNFKALDRAMSKIDVASVTEKWEMEDHLSILKTKWDVVDRQHWELEAVLQGSNLHYYDTFVAMEGKYDDLRRSLHAKIWSTMHYEKSAPKVEIPVFAGNYTEWISFKDLFLETIHNNPSINHAQKLQHLKGKLRGEAARLIQHLNVRADNYNSCWDILTQRYDNQRLQFTSFINIMLNLPVIQHPDSSNLKKLHDVITECLNGLANIGVDTANWDPLVVHLMSQKLDTTTHTEYMSELPDHKELPRLNDFLSFLESKFMAYQSIQNVKKGSTNSQKSLSEKSNNKNFTTKKTYYEPQKSSKTYHTTYGQCPLCNDSHVLRHCPKFMHMDTAQRNDIVAKLHLCKNCLYRHNNDECTSTKTCRECNRRHHTLLHNLGKKTLPTKPDKEKPSTSGLPSANHLANKDLEILLTTVQILVQSANGTFVTLRALLDQGSQVNLITENAAQLLRLPRQRLQAIVSGVGSVCGDCKARIQLTCKSIHSEFTFETQALVMSKITKNLPNSSFEDTWPHIKNLKLADPQFNVSQPVDLLLGAEVYSEIILDGVLKGGNKAPIAQQTQLGWILCGKLQTFSCHMTLLDINEINKFWESEDIQAAQDVPKEDRCEDYYVHTLQRTPEGKYVVKMPLIPNYETKLGNSRSVAVSQFLQLEKRLERNQKLAVMYREFMKEYRDLQHMKPVANNIPEKPSYFLPHHGVLRINASTTKLRVVFNASQKTTSGYSLNQLQEKGPNLQKDIQALILKWRSYRYAYTADIEKMYRCIDIADDQQCLQKIIWRDSPTKRLQEYQLCTVTYGMKCAPWLAMRTIQQLAFDNCAKSPEAAAVLQNEMYVDDLVSGENSIEAAKHLQTTVINLLKGGGMNLRKWSANHPVLLENLSEEQISKQPSFDFKHEESSKTLGLGWNPSTDTFRFNWSLPSKHTQLTKRSLLSEISKLYDPLGWLSPVTVAAKLLFQRVWASKLGWDEALSPDIQEEWFKLKNELPEVKNIELNRWLGGAQQDIQLLGFCDASEKAYSCVIYSRIMNTQGSPTITLLAAKTRVAPLAQKTTLPRLELCGALLLSQLVEKVKKAYIGYDLTTYAWSDSQVVLAWLQGDVSRWDTYVANRVTRIKQVILPENWNYVKSEQNPADCASRGLYPSKLRNFTLWWNGPDFIQTFEQEDALKTGACLHTTDAETNSIPVKTLSTIQSDHFVNELLHKSSSLHRVIRIVAWVLRFGTKARVGQGLDTAYLTASELNTATAKIIKCVQQTEFQLEYYQLRKGEAVSQKGCIYKLHPYLDETGIIRVGGRLNHSHLPSRMKNPIILPKGGRFTQLLIDQAHAATLHGGARLTLTYIRQRYWIVGGNRIVKTRLRHCIRCHRHKPSENNQLMGDLPYQRVTPSRPFTHTGVDFTGHVEVKANKGRGIKITKGYIAIFICMATKAVHIELVSDLSTENFLAAFQRMCARRGTPRHVYSDCGTNFIGASKMLRNEFEGFKQMLSPEFFDEIGKLEVEWHFNAPAWPSAGGLWESAVKSMKHHLRRVLGEQKLTYEEFTTLLTKIEACMNSRPLCPLTEDPEEFYNCLTPGHFLTGGPTLGLPLSDYSDVRTINIRSRWQLTENMLQQFWKSWSNEYLTQLQSRCKWNKLNKNIKQGDVVLVRDNNLPPGRWALGRVLEVHSGSDGLVRVTTLKTQSGTIKRPIVKLSPLPIMEPETTATKPETTNPQRDQKIRNEKTSKKCFWSLFATLLLIFTCITGTHATGGGDVLTRALITSLEPDRPIYYDTLGNLQMMHNEWNLIMYYNLTDYWDNIQRIENYLVKLTDFCTKTDPRYCKPTLTQLSHEINIMHHYNSILLAPHKHLSIRKKRGLVNGIGYVANELFGILDQNFADKYQRDIESVQTNEKYLLELMKNQTSIVELQNKILRKTEDNINQQVQLIDGFMNETNTNFAKVTSAIEVMMATSYFNSASLALSLLLSNLRSMQEMLFNTLTNVYKGHIDIHLLTPVDLIEQLSRISGTLPKSLTLPVQNVREDIRDVYKLLYMKARVTANFFLFEIHIPLTSDEDFQLYKAVPLPVKTHTGTTIIQTQSEYIAVNFHMNTFIPLQESDVKLCTQLTSDLLICGKNMPVYNLNNHNAPCEAKLLSHHSSTPCDVTEIRCYESWVALHSVNSWLAVCCGACSFRTICNSEVTSYTMTSSSIVKLAPGCMLQSQDFNIYSHNEYNSNIRMDYQFNVPSFNSTVNNIVNLTHHNMPWELTRQVSDLQEVDKQLKRQREHEILPETISTHDLHQYIVSYTVVGVAVIGFVVWVLKKRCSSRLFKKKHSPVIQDDVELRQVRSRMAAVPHTSTPTGAAVAAVAVATEDVTFNFN